MEVGTSAPDTPYAAIGGGVAQNFQIAQSAHGFRILSSTLYRDKIRAVVREILCNAIDAHVAAGIGDQPVEVVIDDNQFLVRDRGLGIADDRMVDVFCTYFASTKTQDASQIGGFGLGCKAPFAYSDHFSVTSRHNGTQTAYAIAIGSEQTGGAPSLRKMVAVPTQEQGITVSVPLENELDRTKFEAALKSVVYEGGMNVTLNGMKVEAHDYGPDRERGFSYVRTHGHSESKLRVMCGGVCYSIEPEPSLDVMRGKLHNLVPTYHQLILIAAPGAIRPKPDREGLSYETVTLETLQRLMKRAVHHITTDMARLRRKMLVNAIRKADRLSLDVAAASLEVETEHGSRYSALIEHLVRARFRNSRAGRFEVASIASDILRHGRRSLKRAKAELKKEDGYWYIQPIERDRERILRSQLLRIARAIDAQHRIYSRGTGTDMFAKIYAKRTDRDGETRNRGLGSTQREITIGRTREDCSSRMKHGGFALVLGHEPTQDEIEKVRTIAEKFKFTFNEKIQEDYQPPVRAKRVKADKSAYLEANFGNNSRAYSLLLPRLATITEPAAYFSCGVGSYGDFMHEGKKHQRFTATFSSYMPDEVRHSILNVIPKTIVPATRGELSALKKAGVPRYQDQVLAMAKKRLARGSQNEIDIAILAWMGRHGHSWNDYSTRSRMEDMLRRMHPKTLSFILDLKYTTKMDAVWEFWRHFWALADMSIGPCSLTPEETEETNKVHFAMQEIYKTSLKGKGKHPATFMTEDKLKFSAEYAAIHSLLAIHQSVLTYTNHHLFFDAKRVDLAIDLLKFERKRRAAQAKLGIPVEEGDDE